METYKPSQYNTWYQGKNITYLYNTFTTGLLSVDNKNEERLRSLFKFPNLITTFSEEEQRLIIDNGFLVEEGINELNMVKFRYR
jgi:hypothetical protein